MSCTGFTSTPFKSVGRETHSFGHFIVRSSRCGSRSGFEQIVTFDTDGHVRIDALPGVLQPNFFDL